MKADGQIFRCILALALLSGSVTHGKDPLLRLRGVIDVEGLRAALVEIDYTQPNGAHERRAIRRLMHEGEVLELDEVGGFPRIELLSILAAEKRVRVRENGIENTYVIPSGQVFVPGTNRLALASAAITDVIDILSLLTERTVLFHSQNGTMETHIQIEAHWTNSVTTKPEASRVLESALQSGGAAILLKGNDFLLVVPEALTNGITRGWVSPAVGPPDVAPFAANNPTEAIVKYSELTGRRLTSGQCGSETSLYLRTLKPISEAQAVHAIKTVLDWSGCRIVDDNDKTFMLEGHGAVRRNP